MIQLKAIKTIKKLVCFLSFNINLQFSELYSAKPIGIIMMEAFGLMVDYSMG